MPCAHCRRPLTMTTSHNGYRLPAARSTLVARDPRPDLPTLERAPGVRARSSIRGSEGCGSTRAPKSRHSDKTTTRKRCEGDRCYDPCVRRRNDTVTRSWPISVPRSERLSDCLSDAIEYVSRSADDLTRRTQAGNDSGEHQVRYDDSSNDEHGRASPPAHSQRVDPSPLARQTVYGLRNAVRRSERIAQSLELTPGWTDPDGLAIRKD